MKPEGVGQCPIMFGTNMEAEVVGLDSNYVELQITSSSFLILDQHVSRKKAKLGRVRFRHILENIAVTIV